MTRRELRNQSGEIMRALDRGESFVVTRNGAPFGELGPGRRHHFVAAKTAWRRPGTHRRSMVTAPVTDVGRIVEQGLPSGD